MKDSMTNKRNGFAALSFSLAFLVSVNAFAAEPNSAAAASPTEEPVVTVSGALTEDKNVTGGEPVNVPQEIECPPGTDYDCLELPILPGTSTCTAVFQAPPGRIVLGSVTNQAFCERCECVRGGRGCFAPGTKLTMSDRSQRKIEDIAAGDLLWNPLQKRNMKVSRIVEGPESLPYFHIRTKSASLKLSQGHPVHTAAGVKRASAVVKGDLILNADGSTEPVTEASLLPLEPHQRVLNVVLDESSKDPAARALLSEGIVTGDLVLQQSIAAK